MTEQLAAVEALTANEDSAVLQELCDIFGVEADADAISAAVVKPTGMSIDSLAEALQVPAILLAAYLEPARLLHIRSGSIRRLTDRNISNKEMTELLRHMTFPALRNLRTISLDDISEGTIANEGACEIWVFENPLHGKIVIQTQGELDTQGCLLDSSGRLIDRDDSREGENFKMTCELSPEIYFSLVRGRYGDTGNYSLHVHRACDDAVPTRTTRRKVRTREDSFPFAVGDDTTFHPFLHPLSIQLAELTKLRFSIKLARLAKPHGGKDE